jgi:amino acid permease
MSENDQEIHEEILEKRLSISSIENKKHGSLTNIFSCWNGMVGTGLVTVPWAYSESGIILGVILTILSFLIAFTTQYYIMKTASKDIDYTITLKKTFGQNGYRLGMSVYIMVLMIPITIFFSLLSEFLYPVLLVTINLIAGKKTDNAEVNLDLDFSEFSYSYTCIIIFIYLNIITNRRDMGIFIRINTFGVIFTVIIIVFIATIGL